MADDKYTFEQARIRLEEIAVEVRKKDTSLEKSLDLLEEGVRLANICTELVDHTDTSASVTAPRPEAASAAPEDEATGGAEVSDGSTSDADGEPAVPDVSAEAEVDGFEDVEDDADDDPSNPDPAEVEE